MEFGVALCWVVCRLVVVDFEVGESTTACGGLMGGGGGVFAFEWSMVFVWYCCVELFLYDL